MPLRSLIAALLVTLLAAPASAQREVRAWVYGNSLVHHLTDTDATTVPYWLAILARAGGNGLALSGTWGFLGDFARDLPPEPKWSFAGVTPSWDSDRFAFRRAGIDTVLITPPNFIQYLPADAPYDDGTGTEASPLSDTLRVIDWTSNQAPGALFWIYEGWAEMGGVVAYPPDAADLATYQAFNAAAYHDWYLDYVAAIRAERPDLEVGLIPVASVLARVLTETRLSELPAGALYSDDAPHGTANLYFLAALVTYATLYAEAPPADLDLPDTLDPLIRETYPQIAAAVWAASTGAVLPDAAPALIPETGLADPSLAMGLNGIADWSTQAPFLDLMKTARPWIGHLPGQWGGWEMERLMAEGHLSPEGWPLSLPDGVEAIEAFILTDQPAAATSLAGRYVVTWAGQGALSVTGIARDIEAAPGRITFGYRPGEGLVAIRIEGVDAADPIRDIRVVRTDREAMADAGAVFNPDWIARVRDLRGVRFMDWMMTNGSPQVTWADRPLTTDFSYVWRGVPAETMVRLANEIGADPWFTLPHRADDDYVARFAALVHAGLDPRLRVTAEWSNEVWNFIFPQAIWAQEQARARWGADAGDDAWMQYAGLRAAQVADIWAAEYGADADRLIRVVATHTGWPGLEEPLLEAPLAVAEGLARPADSFDAYAVTGYFGFEIGEDARAEELLGWIADGTATTRVTAELRAGSVAELTDDIWPYHADVADRYGLTLLMYEGGSHVAGHGLQSLDDRLTAFYTAYNYGPEMAALYADLLTDWTALGAGPFNAFVDVAAPTQFGSWGALRHLDDSNPRWSTLMAWNAVPTGLPRAGGTFLHGVVRIGADAGDTLIGTPEEDVLMGGTGDDVLRTLGGADIVHGGPGTDIALLPGVAEDYVLGWEGATALLTRDGQTIRLTSVERLGYGDTEPTLNTGLFGRGEVYVLEPPE